MVSDRAEEALETLWVRRVEQEEPACPAEEIADEGIINELQAAGLVRRNGAKLVLTDLGLEEAAMRELVRCDLLQNKLVEDIRAQTPTVAEQVHVRHIVLNTEDEAKAALENAPQEERSALESFIAQMESQLKSSGAN